MNKVVIYLLQNETQNDLNQLLLKIDENEIIFLLFPNNPNKNFILSYLKSKSIITNKEVYLYFE